MYQQQLIDMIYESSFIPERWPELLDRLAEVIEASFGWLTVFNAQSETLWQASPLARDAVQKVVNEGWALKGLFGQHVLTNRHPGFLIESDIFTPEQLDVEPIYRDLLRPSGFGWGAATVIRMPTGDNVLAGLSRSNARGAVESKYIQILDNLRPHLARSIMISAQMQFEHARAASEALALIGLPALILDEQGRVLAANSLIEAMTDCIQWRARNHVALLDSAADKLLRQAIGLFPQEAALPIRSFPVREDSIATKVMHLIPVRRSARDIFVRCAAVLVVTPVALPQAPPVELVQSLFDLTPAEARVARSLASGETVEAIASARGVSQNTIRAHVRGVLEKTGCNRQTDVVALLTSISAVGLKSSV
jgi:DNA-binding CsgD family transcriptional regulator